MNGRWSWCSTSDNPPLVRLRAAYAATAIAEHFRDQRPQRAADDGLGDALRDGAARSRPRRGRAADRQRLSAVGVRAAAGPAGARRQRAREGSITAFYTVLVEGDDHLEPVADTVRAILDGHIVLSRDLASRNHYPADRRAAESVSRTMPDVTSTEHRMKAGRVREWMATIRDNEDLVSRSAPMCRAAIRGSTRRCSGAGRSRISCVSRPMRCVRSRDAIGDLGRASAHERDVTVSDGWRQRGSETRRLAQRTAD